MSTNPAARVLLPYSVSTGSAYAAFDKLPRTKDYAQWEKNMRHAVTGAVVEPVPVEPDHTTGPNTPVRNLISVQPDKPVPRSGPPLDGSLKTALLHLFSAFARVPAGTLAPVGLHPTYLVGCPAPQTQPHHPLFHSPMPAGAIVMNIRIY